MSQLGADVVQLERLAVSFRTESRRLLDVESLIRSQLRASWWSGDDAMALRERWQSKNAPALRRVAAVLESRSTEVAKQAEQQRRASEGLAWQVGRSVVVTAGPLQSSSPTSGVAAAASSWRPAGADIDGDGDIDFDVSVDPDSLSATLSANGEFTAELKNRQGWGVSFKLTGEASVTGEITSENGRTSYSVEASAEVTASATVSAPVGSVSAGHTEGIETSYEVSMPDDVWSPAVAASANPYDPDSMPTGTTIRADESQHSGSEFALAYKVIRASNSISESEGSSLVVEKLDDDTVRVTTGPTSAVDIFTGFGVEYGPIGLSIGSDVHSDSATMQQAVFDLSTPEGEAAYHHFLVTGEMPHDNGAGVSDVSTTTTFNSGASTSGEIDLGPFSADWDGPSTDQSYVTTTNADGTRTETHTLAWSGNPPVTLQRHFDADGNEIVADRTFTYTIEVNDNTAQYLNLMANGGQSTDGPYEAGQTATWTLDNAQMNELHGNLLETQENWIAGATGPYANIVSNDERTYTVFEFAQNLSENNGQEQAEGFVTTMFHVEDNTGEPLPGTITILPAGGGA